MYNIGKELKMQRELLGISQSKLSKETGIKQQKISYYESDKHNPSINDCIKLADFYGISLDELVGREITGNINIDQRNNNGTINNNF